jgi:excisionase family DNA binding protein
VSSLETKALIAGSLGARTERLQAGDMVTTQEAAELAGTSRVTINAWIAKGRAIGLTQTRRGYRLPKWQFEPAVWNVLARLAQALGTTDGWSLLAFLESPLGGLNGKTPRQAIEQGAATRILELAGAEA